MTLPGEVWRFIVRATAFAPLGYSGSTTPARFVGGTTSGSPASGLYVARDFVVDSARVWICSVGGNPGTWVSTASKAEYDALELRVDDLEADVAALLATVADHESRIAALESP